MNETRYRIRKGWFNKSVLQVLRNSPTLISGVVDSSIRTYWWQDVPFSNATYNEYKANRESD